MPSSIRYEFDERKAAAAAAFLLKQAGGQMKYLRLIKLLYLADRTSFLRYNKPITGDRYLAMKLGPVLSNVLDLIKAEVANSPWPRQIVTDGYFVRLAEGDPDLGPLSEAEIALLEDAWTVCKKLDDWKLSRWTHDAFPEWKDPGESAFDIEPEDILRALQKDDEAIEEARQDAVEGAYFAQLFGR